MKATEARQKATLISQQSARRESVELRKRRAKLKESIPKLRAERIKGIEARFRQRIEYAVEDGRRETQVTLSSDSHDVLRGEYKYLPRSKDGHLKAWGESYLKYAAWGKYVKLVLAKLRRDGYKW